MIEELIMLGMVVGNELDEESEFDEDYPDTNPDIDDIDEEFD